jgi:hypothetical protein
VEPHSRGTDCFHGREARPARAAYVECGHAGRREGDGRSTVHSGTRLLGNDREGQRARDRINGSQPPAGVGLALRLDELLQGVQMNREGVGMNHLDAALHVLEDEGRLPTLLDQLGRADVRDKKGVWSLAPGDGVRVDEPGIPESGPLAPNAHRDAVTLGGPGEQLVHPGPIRVPPGHRRDHERQAEAVPEERDRRIEIRHVELGHGAADKCHVLEPGRAPP